MTLVVLSVADQHQYASCRPLPIRWSHAFLAGHRDGIVECGSTAKTHPDIDSLQLFLRQPSRRLWSGSKLEDEHSIIRTLNDLRYKLLRRFQNACEVRRTL